MILRHIGYVACAALILGVAPATTRAADTNADWLKKPTQQDLLALWPTGALQAGKGGKALVACIVTVQGTLRNCAVVSESPAGDGFGSAALALTAQFLMRPATHDGKPVESQVRIPINFPTPDPETGSRIAGNRMSGGLTVRYLSKMPWAQAPSFSDIVAAYPAKAKAAIKSGSATLDCAFTKTGTLSNCHMLREDPSGFGFATAARQLSSKFAAPTTAEALKAMAGARTQLLVTFDAKSLTDGNPVIGKPQWAALPTGGDMIAAVPPKAEAAHIPTARVILSCVVAPGGRLNDCTVASEDPAGFDFGQATLGLVPKFALSVWTDEGLPTVGGRVRIPIRFNLGESPPPAKP